MLLVVASSLPQYLLSAIIQLPVDLGSDTCAGMDASTLVACFDASFSPNTNVRIASELELRKASFWCSSRETCPSRKGLESYH